MYNGRQQHIQTESIRDQSEKNNPSIDTEMEKKKKQLLDMSRTKFPVMKTKHLAERECTRSKAAPS